VIVGIAVGALIHGYVPDTALASIMGKKMVVGAGSRSAWCAAVQQRRGVSLLSVR